MHLGGLILIFGHGVYWKMDVEPNRSLLKIGICDTMENELKGIQITADCTCDLCNVIIYVSQHEKGNAPTYHKCYVFKLQT